MTTLLVTETGDLAADLLVREFERRGQDYRRLNVDQVPAEVDVAVYPHSGRHILSTPSWDLATDEVRAAWYRRPPHVAQRDAYVDRESRALFTGLWTLVDWWWMNRPTSVEMASSKLWQLREAERLGLRVPHTVVTNSLRELRGHFEGQVVAKTIASALIVVDGAAHNLFTQVVNVGELDAASVGAAPCIFQELVKPGIDVRVTVVDTAVFGTEINAGSAVDWRAAAAEDVEYRVTLVPEALATACLRLCETAGLTYGAFDFVRTHSDEWFFLEVNPSGQWGWIEYATGQPITAAIVDALRRH